MLEKTNVPIKTDVYQKVATAVGTQHVAEFLENLALSVIPVALPYKENWPTDTELAQAYQAMAADEDREKEAREWTEALVGDVSLDGNYEAR
jgi:hypothetical protein